MKRRHTTPAVPAIPPFIDQFGRPTYSNPYGHYRANPTLTATAQPTPAVSPVVINQPPAVAPPVEVAAPVAITIPVALTAPVIASIATEAPEVVAENTAAAIPATSAPRLHLDSHTTTWADRLATTPLAFDTTDPAYQDALARYSNVMGLDTPEVPTEHIAGNRQERRARIHRRVRRSVAVVTAVGSGLVGISAASAMWSTHGSGAAKAKATSMQSLTFGVATTSGTTLLPGSTPGNVTTPGGTMSLNITNPNHFTVNITSVTQAGIVSVDATHVTAGCSSDTGTWPGSVFVGNSGVSIPLKSGLGVAVLPGTHTVTISDSVKMLTTSNNNCQGATFTVPVTITVTQQ